MTLVILQVVIGSVVGLGLLRLWRLTAPSERWLRDVVAAGFLARATLGQALFWISWARLPVTGSLQTGDGPWFFADDAKLYFSAAAVTARSGLRAIYGFDPTAPARIYIQTLSVAVGLVGAVASTAVLLNLFFYLGTGERLGIFRVGGGRGMLWFTEIDTVIFDAVLALFSAASRFRVALRDPLTWFRILITGLIGIPLIYAVSNFGTLSRLREMIYMSIVLTPLAIANAVSRDAPGSPSSGMLRLSRNETIRRNWQTKTSATQSGEQRQGRFARGQFAVYSFAIR
jgi:hypothetical protein